MTDLQDLCRRLRGVYSTEFERKVAEEAADAIEALQGVRETLHATCEEYEERIKALQKEVERLRLENHSLRLNSAEHAQALQKEIEELRRLTIDHLESAKVTWGENQIPPAIVLDLAIRNLRHLFSYYSAPPPPTHPPHHRQNADSD